MARRVHYLSFTPKQRQELLLSKQFCKALLRRGRARIEADMLSMIRRPGGNQSEGGLR